MRETRGVAESLFVFLRLGVVGELFAMPVLLAGPSPFPPPPKILPGLWFVGVGWVMVLGEGGRSCGRLRRRHQDCLPANGTNGREFFYWLIRVDSRAVGFSRAPPRQSGRRKQEEANAIASRFNRCRRFDRTAD